MQLGGFATLSVKVFCHLYYDFPFNHYACTGIIIFLSGIHSVTPFDRNLMFFFYFSLDNIPGYLYFSFS
jgi:hypothetical protein